MKIASSVKSLKKRGDCQVIRRGKSILVISKKKKFKAKQGKK